MKVFVNDFFPLHKQTPCCSHICDPCSWIAQMESGERYPNRVVSFRLNRAHMESKHPTRLVQITLIYFLIFSWISTLADYMYLTRQWSISKSLLCIQRCISFYFCICYVSKYCFLFVWKQIKSTSENKLYLCIIFIFVHLNLLFLHECHTLTLEHVILSIERGVQIIVILSNFERYLIFW